MWLEFQSRNYLNAACCNLSESFETNPAIDVNHSDAITGTKQINMLGLKSPYILITEENVPMVRGASQTYGLGFTPGPLDRKYSGYKRDGKCNKWI